VEDGRLLCGLLCGQAYFFYLALIFLCVCARRIQFWIRSSVFFKKRADFHAVLQSHYSVCVYRRCVGQSINKNHSFGIKYRFFLDSKTYLKKLSGAILKCHIKHRNEKMELFKSMGHLVFAKT